MNIVIINGPNLNLLGTRETEIYGAQGFDSYFDFLKQKFASSCKLEFFQSNVEGELINALHRFGFEADGIVLNAAAYTHTSIGIADAVKAIDCPVIEVHISNVYARENFRHHSYIAPHAKGIITGFGLKSYELGIYSLL